MTRKEGGSELKLLVWLLVACSATLCQGEVHHGIPLKSEISETVSTADRFYSSHFPEHQSIEQRINNITKHFQSIPMLHTMTVFTSFYEGSSPAKSSVFSYGRQVNIPTNQQEAVPILEKELIQVSLKFNSFASPANSVPVSIIHYTKRSYPYLSTDSTLAPLSDVVSVRVGALLQFDSAIVSVTLHIDSERVDSYSNLKCALIEGHSAAWMDRCETERVTAFGTVVCRCPISDASSGLVSVTALNKEAFCGPSPGDDFYCLDGKRWHSRRSAQYDTLYLPTYPTTIQGDLTTNLIVSMAPTSTLTVTGCAKADSVLLMFDADQVNQVILSKGASIQMVTTYGNCDISQMTGEAIMPTDGRCESIKSTFSNSPNSLAVELKVKKDGCKSNAWRIVVGCVFGVIGLSLIVFIIFVVVPYARHRLRRREEVRANTYYFDDSTPKKTTDTANSVSMNELPEELPE